MALLDRVGTLLRANLNDLVEKAENPEKLLKQLLLDMQNQFLQLKTQVAMAIADLHLLEKKERENLDEQMEWRRKAEFAMGRNQEVMARMALERSLTYEDASQNFARQMEHQGTQVQILRDGLARLESKIAETQAKAELLIAQHRHARLARQVGETGRKAFEQDMAFDRLKSRVADAEMVGEGHLLASREMNVEDEFARLEKSDRVDRLLAELRQRVAGD